MAAVVIKDRSAHHVLPIAPARPIVPLPRRVMNAQPALMLWLVHIADKLIELSYEFSGWGNGTNLLNNGLQLLHL